jgi:rhamnulokinase
MINQAGMASYSTEQSTWACTIFQTSKNTRQSLERRQPMAEQVYLAVDLGAESGRIMAGLWNGSRMRLEQVHRFPNEPVEISDSFRWDVPRLWMEIQNGLTIAARRYGRNVVSVGVDTWGVDHVLLSKSSEMLGLPYHYRDHRTHGMLDQACKKASREEIFAETGLQFMEINTLYQLLALQKNNPDILQAANCLLMIPDFLHWCLCGEKVCEFTDATTSQLFHPRNRDWSWELMKRFSLPTNIFPKVVMPGTRLGALRSSLAEKTRLDSVAVVAPATHDTASAVAAVPASHTAGQNWAYISSGTWSLMGIERPSAELSSRVMDLNFTNEGGVDGTYRVLKNIMGLWLVQQCKRSFAAHGNEIEYTDLVRMATVEPPLRSFVNPNADGFLNPTNMPMAIQAFCRESDQPVPESEGALVRCILESLALTYQKVLTGLEELAGHRIEIIHIVGGGSQNDLLNQFTANACSRTVLAGPVEATAMGNLLVQARASNEVKSLQELRTIVSQSSELRVFRPEQASATAWEDARARFSKLSQARSL